MVEKKIPGIGRKKDDFSLFYTKYNNVKTADVALDLKDPIEEHHKQMLDCNLCFEDSHKKCFGSGNTNPLFMFIGDEPSEYDVQSKIFSDKVGQKIEGLIKYLSKEVNLYNNVYITNLVLCNNGDTIKCKKRLEREIGIINPKNIILLGSDVCITMMGKELQKLRLDSSLLMINKFYKTFVTYSLKELFYHNGEVKYEVKKDLDFILKNYEKSS